MSDQNQSIESFIASLSSVTSLKDVIRCDHYDKSAARDLIISYFRTLHLAHCISARTVADSIKRITFFGAQTVGRSSIINSLCNSEVARENYLHDWGRQMENFQFGSSLMLSEAPPYYSFSNLDYLELMFGCDLWRSDLNVLCISHAPCRKENDFFEALTSAFPQTPTICFVNKLDELEQNPPFVQKHIRALIQDTMNKFVNCPLDMVYGNAKIIENDCYIRQDVPELRYRISQYIPEFCMIISKYDPV